MKPDTAIGMLIAGALFAFGVLLFNSGGWATASDIKRQCEAQQSIRLHTGNGEAFFYCYREPKK